MRIAGAALLALCAVASGCGGAEGAQSAEYDGQPAGHAGHAAHTANAAHTAHADHALHREALQPAAASDLSVYNLESVWRDRTGESRPLGSLAGRVQVVAMVYTTCGYACPRLILDMKRIEAEIGERGPDVGLVLVSIDPARDTPERLAEFAAGARLDPGRWTLLTGDDDAVLELAAVLGVQYRESAPGEFVHSNLLTVLDPEGVIVHRQEGLGAEPSATVAAIRALGS